MQPNGTRTFIDREVVERMMLPAIVEATAAPEEGVVGTVAEFDTALLLDIGFPAYLDGPCATPTGSGSIRGRTLPSAMVGSERPTARRHGCAMAAVELHYNCG